MASSIEYLQYILELLTEVGSITYKKMMGEYLLYKDGVLFGGIYDNRFLIKKSESTMKLGLKEEIPYPGGKAMLLVDFEDRIALKEMIERLVLDIK